MPAAPAERVLKASAKAADQAIHQTDLETRRAIPMVM
jgi:hypothetical protein